MRIAIDYTAAINQRAGIGRFVRNLVHSLVALDSTGQFTLVRAAPNNGRVEEFPRDANVAPYQLQLPER